MITEIFAEKNPPIFLKVPFITGMKRDLMPIVELTIEDIRAVFESNEWDVVHQSNSERMCF